jgi:beta propeller repeat protein
MVGSHFKRHPIFLFVALLIVLLFSLQSSTIAQAWGSLRDGWLDYNTHGNIDAVAYRALEAEVNLMALAHFPDESGIFDQDFVAIGYTGAQLATSTGPDYEPAGGTGPITPFSWHYGDGPLAAQNYYNYLLASLKTSVPMSAHNAAWMAHFTADQFVPWHTEGVRYVKQTADELDDPLYNDRPEDFLKARAKATNGNLNWYDPSYWDSKISTNNSTHIYWERQVVAPTTPPTGFDPLWNNSLPLTSRVSSYVQEARNETIAKFQPLVDNPVSALARATTAVYTVLRGSISALNLSLNVAPGGADTFKVVAVVRNLDRLYDAANVKVKITLPAGYTLVNPPQDVQVVGNGSVAKIRASSPVEWEVQPPTASSSGCPIITVSVTGDFPTGGQPAFAPDLAGPSPTFGQVEETVYPPPTLHITSPAAGDVITDTKVDVTGEISDPNTQSWIEVNNSDRIWISQDFNTGTSFKKQIELKSGDNVITVHAVNRCGKENRATIQVKGNFSDAAIKVVMSWNTDGTDVDLHLTDSNGGDECYYNDKNPNWGDQNSSEDDPLLDIDNTWGYGPETIILPKPKPGQYTVRVVYFTDNNEEEAIPSFVTVKVYENGVIKGTFNHTLEDTGDTWEDVYTYNIQADSSLQPAAPASDAAVVSGAAAVPTAAGHETRITNNPSEQRSPAISGNQIVWADGRNGNHLQIYRYDLNTHTESRVSTVPLNSQQMNPPPDPPLSSVLLQNRAAISGSSVVWIDNRYDHQSVYLADLSAKTETPVFPQSKVDNSPLAIDGTRMVWADTRNSTDSASNTDIYMYDFSTQTETRITTNASDQLAPDISGNTIVWTDTRLGGYTIFMYDLTTHTETQVSRASSGEFNPPKIDGNYIVWEDGRNGKADIFLYDISSREERQITTNPAEQTSPDVSGNRIVWVDYRNGNPDIYMFDLATNIESSVVVNPAEQIEPSIDGNRIVWTDYRNGNPDIYMFDLGGIGKVFLPLLTRSTGTIPPAGGISGLVSYNGAPKGGLALTLRFWNGTSWSIQATTTSGADGKYAFTNLPTLATGQLYYVRYDNPSSAPNPGPGYLFYWLGNQITTYTGGSTAAGGDFDTGDIGLVSPDQGASITLPAEFCWTPRGISSDNYQIAFYNVTLDKTAYSNRLGSSGCVTITNLPADWTSGGSYQWYVIVYQSSNPDAAPYNYGASYYSHSATINFSAAASGNAPQIQWKVAPGDPRR